MKTETKRILVLAVVAVIALCCRNDFTGSGDDDGNGGDGDTNGSDNGDGNGAGNGGDSNGDGSSGNGSVIVNPDFAMGPGTSHEYNTESGQADGVGINDDGWLVLSTRDLALRYLWVANSADGTVSRIDTATLQETGRYHVGLNEDRADPSRTSVDLAGDVFVGNRNRNYGDPGSSSVTKIVADPERCVDRNGNGIIETSTGPDDVYPRSTGDGDVPAGQSTDECVIWTRGFDDPDADPASLTSAFGCHGLRAVAATAETGDNYEYNGHVWVGCLGQEYGAGIVGQRGVYKLNGNTGDILESHQLPNCNPYGFFLEGEDRLWVSCRQAWNWVDGDAGIAWMGTGNGAENFMPRAQNVNPYGIAGDAQGRIWITVMGNSINNWIYRYTPSSTPDLGDGTWEGMPVNGEGSFRGIAVDAQGWVWAINTDADSRIYLIDPVAFPDPSAVIGQWYLGDDDDSGTIRARDGAGVAVDFSGHVWGISRCMGTPNGYATRLEIDRSGAVPAVVGKDILPVGREPYTYSDMIGYNLRTFASKEGWYRQVFEVCPGESTRWKEISWDGIAPKGTSFVIRVRTADYRTDLSTAPWVTAVRVPDDSAPKTLPSDLPEGHFIEIEARLYTSEDNVTPAVGPIGFTFECTNPIVIE